MAKKSIWFVIINADNGALAIFGEDLEEEARAKTKELRQQAFHTGGVFLVRTLMKQPHLNETIPKEAITRQIYVSILGLDDCSYTADNAEKIADWLKTRGGIAVWRSLNLSNPGMTWTTPYLDEKGEVKERPHREADPQPTRVITDPAAVWVAVPKEVKRFHIAVRMGGLGLSVKLTDGATRRVREAVEKEGVGAWYELDYMTQEAVIYVAEKEQRIFEFLAEQKSP